MTTPNDYSDRTDIMADRIQEGLSIMPLQNRVDPFGGIHAVAARGMFTGNRGVIHDPATRTLLGRRWTTKAWIVCACDFKGRRRDVMGRNAPSGGAGWTELFFLDEVTALAAGHRPCFFCRREAAKEYAAGFPRAFGVTKPTVKMMDERLHAERWASGGHSSAPPSRSCGPIHLPPTAWGGGYPNPETPRPSRLSILHPTNVGGRWLDPEGRDGGGVLDATALPDGTMLSDGKTAYALRHGKLLSWSFDGYREPVDLAALGMDRMDILTPATTIAVLSSGFAPVWHPSAGKAVA